MENQFYSNNVVINTTAEKNSTRKFESIELTDAIGFNKHINTLSNSQNIFVDMLNEWFKEKKNTIILISGSPGSGKTYTVIETVEYLNVKVLKMAPTCRLAKNINGYTVHKAMKLNWLPNSVLQNIIDKIAKLEMNDDYIQTCLEISKPIFETELCCSCTPNIVVIDEIGMIPFWLIYHIIAYFFKTSPVLIIALGDKDQLRPVNCDYNIFNVTFSDIDIKQLSLKENKRFTNEYFVIINTLKKLMSNPEEMFKYIELTYPMIKYITESLIKDCSKILVYKNKTAQQYNNNYLDLLNGPDIYLPQIYNNQIVENNYIRVKNNCDVIVTETNELPNGSSLKFLYYNNVSDEIVCKYYTKEVNLSRSKRNGMFPIAVAFATTIHKYQGDTINEKIIIDFDHSDNVHLIYTALSRVRSMNQIIGILNIK
ncbi:uncharacterized protein TNCT_229681 [Trichonephila clavata]|uniref:UvrD-like helicase C-terminal domain-containing protein n=1 Tax=Trichonephila clavata TaxID=2740835 RepID=A0A8X6KJA9_TRICU|nr:uncharacterized protein TNCT_229681 [Trichonephila clavata]